MLLGACGEAGKQWIDPDKTFAALPQPEVKGISQTQEEMAKEAFANGDYERAAKFYQLLVAQEKGTPEQMLRYKQGLATSARRLGKNDQALAMYDQLIKENPSNLDAQEGKGLTLMAMGKSAEATQVFSELVAKDSSRWQTLNALGILFVTKNMIPEAMAYYAEALKHSPENAAVLNNMGLSLAIDGKHQEALTSLGQAARFSKSANQRKQIELNTALVYAVSNDLDHAREIASKYFEGPALDNNMGLYAHLAKNDSLAKTYLNMALSQSPVFYERAWDNLDALGDTGGPAGPAAASELKLVPGNEAPKAQ